MNKRKMILVVAFVAMLLTQGRFPADAQDKSRYRGSRTTS